MLPKSAFFKENFVVVLGVALPLLLVVVFALARVFSETTVAAPQYRAVYAQSANVYNGHFRYNVGAGKKLTVTYEAPHYNGRPLPQPIPVSTTIFVTDAKSGAVLKHTYTVPNAYAEGVTPIDTSDLDISMASQGATAPDGYVYSKGGDISYSDGLLPEIFGYNHHYGENHMISKEGRSFALETPNSYDLIEFIGWAKD